jgi:hypothetical protein
VTHHKLLQLKQRNEMLVQAYTQRLTEEAEAKAKAAGGGGGGGGGDGGGAEAKAAAASAARRPMRADDLVLCASRHPQHRP